MSVVKGYRSCFIEVSYIMRLFLFETTLMADVFEIFGLKYKKWKTFPRFEINACIIYLAMLKACVSVFRNANTWKDE